MLPNHRCGRWWVLLAVAVMQPGCCFHVLVVKRSGTVLKPVSLLIGPSTKHRVLHRIEIHRWIIGGGWSTQTKRACCVDWWAKQIKPILLIPSPWSENSSQVAKRHWMVSSLLGYRNSWPAITYSPIFFGNSNIIDQDPPTIVQQIYESSHSSFAYFNDEGRPAKLYPREDAGKLISLLEQLYGHSLFSAACLTSGMFWLYVEPLWYSLIR